MDISCSQSELYVFEKIAEAAKELGFPAYIIGGFVRDKLIGRQTKDADIVCVGDGIALARKVSSKFNPSDSSLYFKTFGTAHIKLEDFEIEFVGARKESYRSESRNPEVQPGTLEDDQKRRDFTINALAISLNKDDYGNSILDPFNGIRDIERKIIETPLDPEKTFRMTDILRMMRAIRFASQLDFKIEDETYEAIIHHVDRINIITQERITEELNKIIASPKPSVGLDLLYRTGLMKIIFPQMVDLAGAKYIDGHGHKDNFYHTLQVIDNVAEKSNDLWLRWSAVLHDIAKNPQQKNLKMGMAGLFTDMR